MVTDRLCVFSESERGVIRVPIRELGRSVIRRIVEDRVSSDDLVDCGLGAVVAP